ncbi:hypothetical protein HanRHA438_Chr12g0551111 [Helianthus annuus]|nr:hypothetical protein HanRHA438_Chr12g0551111 [Helianthus annuus]
MDAHEWNESLDRIISTIAEMIDLLKNESRRWATSPIFSTPQPSPAAASPPPTSATEPPSPASAIITPPALPLKTAQTPSLVPVPKSVHVAVSTSARKSASSLPKPTLFYPPIYTISTSIKPTVATLTSVFNQKATHAMEKNGSIVYLEGEDFDNRMLNHFVWKIKRGSPNVEATGETDLQPRVVAHLKWRLRPVATAPYEIVRLEWRPPWFPPSRILIFALRTSRIRAGWNDMCPSQ